MRPDFILADEIVSASDVSSQAQVLALLAELMRDLGLTFAFINHDLSVNRRLYKSTMVLHNGQIVEHRPTGRFLLRPKPLTHVSCWTLFRCPILISRGVANG